MVLKIDPNFEGKLTYAFKTEMSIQGNFNLIT